MTTYNYTWQATEPKIIYHGSQHASRLGWSVSSPTASTFYAWAPHAYVPQMKLDGWIVSTKSGTWTTATHTLLEWKPA